jgi:secondary thiamine-phosphate synthase enzyme
MSVYQEEFEIRTKKRTEVVDATEKVEGIIEKSGIKNGMCLIFAPHATAAIILEEPEQGLMKDIEEMVEKKFPRNAGYKHDRVDDNTDAHLASAFIGQSQAVPVRNRRMIRGTWQNPMLLELDGPRNRRVFVTVIGD